MSKNTPINPNSLYPNRVDIEYYFNGIVRTVRTNTHYVNYKKHGMDIRWYSNDDGGGKWEEIMWANGEVHGVATLWYESGQKKWQGMWKEGKRHGLGRAWYESGVKKWETYYLHDKQYAQIEWDEEGKVSRTEFLSEITNPTPKVRKNVDRMNQRRARDLGKLLKPPEKPVNKPKQQIKENHIKPRMG